MIKAPIPNSHTYARYLNDDIRYRIASVHTWAGVRIHEMINVHRIALESIPDPVEWSRGYEQTWHFRIVRHLSVILSATDDKDHTTTLIDRLFRSLVGLDPSAGWFKMYRRFWSRRDEYPNEVISILKRSLQIKNKFLDRDKGVDSRLRLIGLLIAEPERYLATAIEAVVRLSLGEAVAPEPEDVELVSVTLSALDQNPVYLLKNSSGLCKTVEKLICSLSAENIYYTGVERLHRECLIFISDRYVSSMHTSNYGSERDAQIRFRRVQTKLDGIIDNYLSDLNDPWLWDVAADLRIRLVKEWLSINRSNENRTNAGKWGKRYLEQFRRQCVERVDNNHVVNAVSARIARYLWDFDMAVDCLEKLLSITSIAEDRKRVVRLGVDILSTPVLVPQCIAYEPSQSLLHRSKPLFISCLQEHTVFQGSERLRRWAVATINILEHGDESQVWVDLLDSVEKWLGPLHLFWQQVLAQRESEGNRLELESGAEFRHLLDDLTDVSSLRVVSRLLCVGCETHVLPPDLRKRLGDANVIVAESLASWNRSVYQESNFVIRWHLGVSIGLALLVSPDGKILGSFDSYSKDKNGCSLSWAKLMKKYLNEACSLAVGQFRDHAANIRTWLVDQVDHPDRAAAQTDEK